MSRPDDSSDSLDEIVQECLKDLRNGSHAKFLRWLAAHPDQAPELAARLAAELDQNDRTESLDHSRTTWSASAHVEEFDRTKSYSSSELPDLTPSIELGDYELLAEIGRGGMGVVYQARRRSLDQLVALKVIRADDFSSVKQINRFQSEARILARCQHRYIVPIYDIGEEDGLHYFSMKLIETGSLVGKRFSPREAALVVAKIASAISYANALGVIHRDLKPGNILLDRDLDPYVADFGLARWIEMTSGTTFTGAIVGTIPYMAPEQARGERNQTPSVDVYGLGAILYYLLTSRPPFRGETPEQTLHHVADRFREVTPPEDLNRDVDSDLNAICLRALTKNPAGRFESAAEMTNALQNYLDGKQMSHSRPSMLSGLRDLVQFTPRDYPEYVTYFTTGGAWTRAIGPGIAHLGIFAMIAAGVPAGPIMAFWATWLIIVSLTTLRYLSRFHSMVLSEKFIGTWSFGLPLVLLAILFVYGPWDWWAPGRELLPVYPVAALIGALGFVTMSPLWGRWLISGAVMLGFGILIQDAPLWGPVGYAIIWTVSQCWPTIIARRQYLDSQRSLDL